MQVTKKLSRRTLCKDLCAKTFGAMSFLSALPSFNKANFSLMRTTDPSRPSSHSPLVYCPTHETSPPPNQVITTEKTNILLRQFSALSDKSHAKQKRAHADANPEEDSTERPKKTAKVS
mmetsp:Transcript_48934/g.81425  ORF Transcript_48934/g.81425 Transcript_48934/m.81425 type:complete len:119 (-) Transcript_48934:343-699(-)